MINYHRLILLCIISFPNFLNGQLTTLIKYEYYTSTSNYFNTTEDSQTNGYVSPQGSQFIVRNGRAFTLVDSIGRYDACRQPVKQLNYSNGVAIIQRGGDCTFSIKITRAKRYGAIAVIIYNPQSTGQDLITMVQNTSDVLSVYVQRSIGSFLFDIANDKRSYLNITLEPISGDYDDSGQGGSWITSKSGTIFLSVTICIFILVCISWLIFYLCQRRRSRTAKDHLKNRLTNAAKKALKRIPLITVTENSPVEESCVICLDAIKVGDTVRKILCGHTFHHRCVDPWLINHRHCPLCNLDILAAYHIPVPAIETPHHSVVQETPIPSYYTSLATTAATPIGEQNIIHRNEQQTVVDIQVQPIPSISGVLKDEDTNVHIHGGEQNPSFRSGDNNL